MEKLTVEYDITIKARVSFKGNEVEQRRAAFYLSRLLRLQSGVDYIEIVAVETKIKPVGESNATSS